MRALKSRPGSASPDLYAEAVWGAHARQTAVQDLGGREVDPALRLPAQASTTSVPCTGATGSPPGTAVLAPSSAVAAVSSSREPSPRTQTCCRAGTQASPPVGSARAATSCSAARCSPRATASETQTLSNSQRRSLRSSPQLTAHVRPGASVLSVRATRTKYSPPACCAYRRLRAAWPGGGTTLYVRRARTSLGRRAVRTCRGPWRPRVMVLWRPTVMVLWRPRVMVLRYAVRTSPCSSDGRWLVTPALWRPRSTYYLP